MLVVETVGLDCGTQGGLRGAGRHSDHEEGSWPGEGEVVVNGEKQLIGMGFFLRL